MVKQSLIVELQLDLMQVKIIVLQLVISFYNRREVRISLDMPL